MRGRALALCAILAVQPVAAGACSFSWTRGYSPAEIKLNPEMRAVTGTFRFIQNPENGHIVTDGRGYAYGRIETTRRQFWNTIQLPLNEFSIECGAYTAPTGNDATGTFWISYEPRRGRYLLMLWEPARPGDATARHRP